MSLIHLSYNIYDNIFKFLTIDDLMNLYQIEVFKDLLGDFIKERKKEIKNYLFQCVKNDNTYKIELCLILGVSLNIHKKGNLYLSTDNDDVYIPGIITKSYNLLTYAIVNNCIESVDYLLNHQNKKSHIPIYNQLEKFHYSNWALERGYFCNNDVPISAMDIALLKRNDDIVKILDYYCPVQKQTTKAELFKYLQNII